MAENKKSFILYTDLIHTVRKLPKAKQAELFMAILEYVNDENPEVKDVLVGVAFEPIKHQLKRDLSRWDNFKKKQSENGKMGGRPRREETQINPNNPSLLEETQKSLNVTVNVNDTVTDNVTEESITRDLRNSNLFKQPNIPTEEEVHRAFFSAGGTEEMAKAFFNKNTATGWLLRGSAITNFKNLLPSFITNWNKNLKNASNHRTTNGNANQQAARTFLESAKADYLAATGGK